MFTAVLKSNAVIALISYYFNQHCFVNVIRVSDELEPLISGVYILTVLVCFCHVQCPPSF